MAEHRREFDRQLGAIDVKVIELFAMVCEDLPGVTKALLSGSNEAAGQLAERERLIDALYREIERLVSREILLQAPVASDLRFLLIPLASAKHPPQPARQLRRKVSPLGRRDWVHQRPES